MDKIINVNNITLHYLDRPGGEPTLILLHGLTANAHAFDGIVQAGLSPRFRTLSVDLRGRGQSDKPASGYSLADHAGDILGLMETTRASSGPCWWATPSAGCSRSSWPPITRSGWTVSC